MGENNKSKTEWGRTTKVRLNGRFCTYAINCIFKVVQNTSCSGCAPVSRYIRWSRELAVNGLYTIWLGCLPGNAISQITSLPCPKINVCKIGAFAGSESLKSFCKVSCLFFFLILCASQNSLFCEI